MGKLWPLLLALLTCSLIVLPPQFVSAQTCLNTTAQCDWPNGLRVSARQTFYTIEGETAPQLVAQIQNRGPLWSNGYRYEAMHTWKLNRSYSMVQQGDRCHLITVNIAVESEITLPHWEPPADASGQLVANWDHYTKALKQHENGHRDISIAAGEQVLQQLRRLPNSATCAQLRTAAKAIVDDILEQTSNQQRDYDASTQHGLTQGASYSQWLN
ncbi:DUF922 domain-containing protein [Microcoleus sp. FACHB-1515]|uniref:DUF922 domain-containing protein n=1 Tax=Cyanophyceae TaxID=3028117 RepID=UPI001687F845|nr:DUF922 domain-containing protein [Microcoleus sp. FACHB-1515]MBD2090494.1 DUF922 domain-containing protein [Microcoleus sp. FACHB-1515]